MKNIVIISNHHSYTYNFRKEIIQSFLDKGHQVHLVLPYGENVEKLKNMGCGFTNVELERRGTSIVSEFKLFMKYLLLIKKLKPDYVYSYTIKPNIYGGLVCKVLNIPFSPNITGLGSALNKKSNIKKLLLNVYKIALKNANTVFFQNEANKNYFVKNKLISGNYTVLPGSGINVDEFNYLDYPMENEGLKLLFVGRIMKDKGIAELVEANQILKEKYPEIKLQIIGFCEDDYQDEFKKMKSCYNFEYLGYQKNPRAFIKNAHAIILPSYHEGMSNVLLEAAASGRPLLASRIPGCEEIFDENETGYGFEPRSVKSIINTVERFRSLSYEEKVEFGKKGREKVLREFNRQIIVDEYLKVL